jgi:hypothetical protein
MGCEDNDDVFLSRVQAQFDRPTFAELGVLSCADAVWLPVGSNCDTRSISVVCRMVRRRRVKCGLR